MAVENLGRRCIGIDISPKAVELVDIRLQQSMGDLFHNRLVTARTDIPRPTDIDAPVPYRQNKHVLFGQQEGRCNGCRSEFPFRILEVDHVIPLGGGGQDNIENLQLLCVSLQSRQRRPVAGRSGGQAAGVGDRGVNNMLSEGSTGLTEVAEEA